MRIATKRKFGLAHLLFKGISQEALGKIGIAIIILFGVMALVSPFVINIDPDVYDPLIGVDPLIFNSQGPTLTHPLGTDHLGRDVLSQLLKGSQIAFLVGITVGLMATLIGTAVGLISGYFRGATDSLLMRITDIILSIPSLPLLIMILCVFEHRGIWVIVMVLGLTGWPITARVIRSQTLSLRERPFVQSARVSGASDWRIILIHIAPNVLPLTFLYMTIGVTYAILTEAGLGFLGFSDPTISSWGMMLQWCFSTGHTFRALYWMIPPGLSISLLALSFYLVGYSLEREINPRLREP